MHGITMTVAGLLLLLALGLIFVAIRAAGGVSRGEMMAVKEVFKLRRGVASRETNWWLKSSPSEVELINRLAATLEQNGARIVRHDPDQLVACFGSRDCTKIKDLQTGTEPDMPTRVILKGYDMQGEAIVRLRMDDDLGFQFPFGPRRRQLPDRYRIMFDRIDRVLLADLARHDPQPNRIIFWT